MIFVKLLLDILVCTPTSLTITFPKETIKGGSLLSEAEQLRLEHNRTPIE